MSKLISIAKPVWLINNFHGKDGATINSPSIKVIRMHKTYSHLTHKSYRVYFYVFWGRCFHVDINLYFITNKKEAYL